MQGCHTLSLLVFMQDKGLLKYMHVPQQEDKLHEATKYSFVSFLYICSPLLRMKFTLFHK